MKYIKKYFTIFIVNFIITLIFLINTSYAEAKVKSDWFDSYDINDHKKMWELLQRPITVLDADDYTKVYLLDKPKGKKIKTDKFGGYIYSQQAAVRVLGEDKDGYTLIEGYDEYDRLLQGYVKTSLLKQVTPDDRYGIIVDKLTQKLYIFEKGELITELLVSTGLVNKTQPFNETASGEYLISSWTGDFWSGNMLCRKGLRFNGGDLLHVVPALVNKKDGSYDYSIFEKQLGKKASHGCVRVQIKKNEDGYNMEWLWDNLKKKTKVIIFDDDGRERDYPDDYTPIYYNPSGGKYYHSDPYCPSVKDKYLPLTKIYYGQLRDEKFKDLLPSPDCNPVQREETIDNLNRSNLSDEDYSSLMKKRKKIHEQFDPNGRQAVLLDETPDFLEKHDFNTPPKSDNNNTDKNTSKTQNFSNPHMDSDEVELEFENTNSED